MCNLQKIYRSQLLLLLGPAPFVALLMFRLLDGLLVRVLVVVLLGCCTIAANTLELTGMTAFLDERDRQIREGAIKYAFKFYCAAALLGASIVLWVLGGKTVHIPYYIESGIGFWIIWGSFCLLLCARDVAGLILYRRGGLVSKPSITTQLLTLRFGQGEMTQQELAERVGVTRQTIIALEASKYVPSLVLAIRIARVFELPVEQVFTLEES